MTTPKMTEEQSPKVNIILDASKIDLFETCPCRFNIRHNLNRTLPMQYKAKALDLGGLAHEGLAVYYTELAKNTPYTDRLDGCLMKIREIASDPDQSNSEPEDVTNLLTSIEQCLDYWRADDENCLEILAVEQPFAYILFEDDLMRFILSGKIDLLVNFHGIGRNASYDNLVMDHKTFTRDGPVLRLSNQFINYCKAVGSHYLVVNRIGLHDPWAKKPKTAEEKYKRLPLSYDPIFIQDWADNMTKMLVNEFMGCVTSNYWPMKPTSCNKFNRLCEYYDGHCDRSGQDAKEQGLRDIYVEAEPWDVTAKMRDD